jgi:hypothetical protein
MPLEDAVYLNKAVPLTFTNNKTYIERIKLLKSIANDVMQFEMFSLKYS